MKCPVCGRPTRVIASEQLTNGCVRARRICTIPPTAPHAEREFDTVEVPATVIDEMGAPRFERAAQRALRGFAQRARAWLRRTTVQQAPEARTGALARQLGITTARVRQIRSELDA